VPTAAAGLLLIAQRKKDAEREGGRWSGVEMVPLARQITTGHAVLWVRLIMACTGSRGGALSGTYLFPASEVTAVRN